MNTDRIRHLTPYALANRADCLCPDGEDTPGARFLTAVRDDLIERLGYETPDEIRDGDTLHEIADGAPDCYTQVRWNEFVDLGAWEEDLSELGGPGPDMTVAAGMALYIIAERLVVTLLDELGDDDDDDTDEDTEVE